MKHFLFTLIICTSMITLIQASDTTTVLHYLVRQPKIKSAKSPVIILLHGVGSNEDDLYSFADQLPEKYLVISARAPLVMGPESYAWYIIDYSAVKPILHFEEEEKSRKLIIQFIGQLKQKFSIDENQVYLCGFSQGAIISYSVALTRPDLVKGIAVMSGRLLDEIKPLIAAKEKLKHLQVFISHGTNDKTLRIQYARNAVAYLKTLDIQAVYKEYPEGHTISREMLSDLINWLQ